jgi:hypothetical protein
MTESDQPDQGPAPDWEKFLEGAAKNCGDEFDLTQLASGDELRVTSENTVYLFRMVGSRDATLVTDRPDRPSDRVRLMGCTFGLSSTIRPDHLFCGGNLEFTFERGQARMTHTTTAIRRIDWLRREEPPKAE